jgi:high-affinity iron transporter
MKRNLFLYFLLLILIAAATAAQQRIFSPPVDLEEQDDRQAADTETDQRLIFVLQYIASDYDRAVQNGQIVDSLEYNEMQRFSHNLVAIYESTTAVQKQTLNQLHEIEELIANRAAPSKIRKICAESVARLIKEKNLVVFPQIPPHPPSGKILFQENCVSCHGLLGAGDGPSADTLNPKPRDFTAPERMNVCTPLQFYQAVTFGVDGTAMPSFAEAFTPRQRWNLAFYLMTLRQDFQPLAPTAPQKLTLRELATKNNIELQAILSRQNRWRQPDSSLRLNRLVDYFRQNPPELTMDECIAIIEKRLQQSLSAYQRGDSTAAIDFADEAYWQGFEPIEGKLLSRVYLKFERTHTEYHWCIEEKGSLEQARALVKTMLDILLQIRNHKGLRRS